MTEIFEALKTFFTDDEWSYTAVEGKPVLRMPFRGKSGNWNCYAQAREDQQVFIFYSVCPINIPPEKYAEVAEFLTRANYGLPLGNFEMDYTDGEVRYKCSIDADKSELTSSLISNVVYANVGTLDRYLPGLMQVVFGNVTPLEAVAKIEG
jgi:hypothetical protein